MDTPPSAEGQERDISDPQKFLEMIPQMAKEHVDLSKDTFGVTLDYSEESLHAIDEIISNHWPEAPVFLEQVVMTFGAYVGETIRRLQGGTWIYDADTGYALSDAGGAGVKIYPFNKVNKRFINGEEDSLSYYYRVICKVIAENKLPGEEAAG